MPAQKSQLTEQSFKKEKHEYPSLKRLKVEGTTMACRKRCRC